MNSFCSCNEENVSDVLLVKTDQNGDTLWTRTYGRAEVDSANPVLQTHEGGYVVAGWTESLDWDRDVYLVKTEPCLADIDRSETSKDSHFGLQSISNPSKVGAVLKYTLPTSSDAQIAIYSVSGQEVMSLVNGKLNAGTHTVGWNGRGNQGTTVRPGIYFVRLQAGDQIATREIVLAR